MAHFKTFFQQIRYFRDLSKYSYGFVCIKDRRGEVYLNKWKKRCIWSLSSERKTERVREDASGDREDGKEEDDDMPCVIGESFISREHWTML